MKFLGKIVVFLFLFFFFTSPLQALSPGDLIINEIMKDPSAVTDANGEWFEIYNPTNTAINLQGLKIKDNDSDDFIIDGNGSVSIPAFGYFVFGRNADVSQNGGVEIDYKYSGFILANNEDEIIILTNGLEIDRVEYDNGINWPDPVGASTALLDPNFDNNLASSWVDSTTPYGDGDLGTPGEANFPATPTPTSTPIPTSTPTSTPTPTETPSPAPSPTPTLTPSPTSTPLLSPTPHPPSYRQFFRKRFRHFLFYFFRFFYHFPQL